MIRLTNIFYELRFIVIPDPETSGLEVWECIFKKEGKRAIIRAFTAIGVALSVPS